MSTQFSDPSARFHYTHPTPQAIADELARLGVGADTPVVVYDSTGTLWAARLWYLLRWIGIDARVLDGGLSAWRAAGEPVQIGENRRGRRGRRRGAPIAPWPAAGRDRRVDRQG
ncbi:MAG: rhodanese-like domain-containing protein [Galbitalea sp.]